MGEALIVRRGGGSDLSGATVTSSGDWTKGMVVLSGVVVYDWENQDMEVGTAILVDGVCIHNDFPEFEVYCTSTGAGWRSNPDDEYYIYDQKRVRITF